MLPSISFHHFLFSVSLVIVLLIFLSFVLSVSVFLFMYLVCVSAEQRGPSQWDTGLGSSSAPAPPPCPSLVLAQWAVETALPLELPHHPFYPQSAQTPTCWERVCPSLRTFCWEHLVQLDYVVPLGWRGVLTPRSTELYLPERNNPTCMLLVLFDLSMWCDVFGNYSQNLSIYVQKGSKVGWLTSSCIVSSHFRVFYDSPATCFGFLS